MDAKLKAKWVRALRSGKYTQGKNHLFHAGRYCCLGVLAEIVNGKRPPARACWGDPELGNMPTEMEDIGDDDRIKLVAMNDGDGEKAKSFRQIADHIEKNL